MTDFHDVSFPLSLAFGASGGPSRTTEITRLASGAEHRNAPHANSRRRYNVSTAVKSLDEYYDLIRFFEARFGQLYSFRFRDPMDYKSCKPSETIAAIDQVIGEGDGVSTEFYLEKNYADIAAGYARRITKPVPDSVKIALDGGLILPVNYAVDALTGTVTFNSPPALGQVISAGCEFDVPVRFDTDQIDVSLEAFGAGQSVSIPLIEVIDYA